MTRVGSVVTAAPGITVLAVQRPLEGRRRRSRGDGGECDGLPRRDGLGQGGKGDDRLGINPGLDRGLEGLGLQAGRVGVAHDDGRQRGAGNQGRRHRIKILVQPKEAVSVAEGLELPGDDGLEGGADDGAGSVRLGQAADEQVDAADVTVGRSQVGLEDGSRA